MYRDINILLVEDNPGDAFLIKEMLRASEFNSATLLTSSTLKDALTHSNTGKNIPLILLDLGLPDSDGLESVHKVRKHFPDAALNILTGFNDKQTANLALREGVQNYLVKGEIDSAELEEAIRYSLERHNFINKLKAASASIKLSEQKYKLLFQNNPMPMWVLDYKNNLGFIDVNDAALVHYGYTREEFLSLTSVDIRPPEDRKRYVQLYRPEQSGSRYAGIWKHIKKDGTIIDVEIRTHDIIYDEKEARLVLANDVTEKLKAEEKIIRSEEQYKDLVENITDLICTHDLDGRILSSNKAASEVTGYDFAPEKKWNIRDILSHDKKDGFDAYIALIKEKGHAEGLMKVRTQTGEIRIWEYQNTLKTDGDIPIVRGYARDITERRKAEEEIKESHRVLKELNAHLQSVREEERTHLAREVHDVLGQQITGLKMDMAWLGKKIPNKDKAVEERFAEMISLADEMVKTIRKIASELRPGILDDLGLVPALEWQSSEFEKRTGIKCYFTSDNALPDLNKSNATGIFRIYQETLTNVARHSEATKVNVSISCSDGAITLTVADNGKGLNPEELKVRKTLGIVGMRERAAMMMGNLSVLPQSQGGTVVTLSVPTGNNTE